MGTVVAARLAVELGRCPADVAQRIVALLGHLGLPTAALATTRKRFGRP